MDSTNDPSVLGGMWPPTAEQHEKARRQAAIQQRVLAQQQSRRSGGLPQQGFLTPQQIQQGVQQAAEARGQRGREQPERENGEGQQAHAEAAPRQMNMFQEHAAAQQGMLAATNDAWAREMDSRRGQAEADRERQHEYEIEALRQQPAQQARAAQGQASGQAEAARRARNASLLGAAGLGGYTIHSDGYGNTSFNGGSPFARSLLGE